LLASGASASGSQAAASVEEARAATDAAQLSGGKPRRCQQAVRVLDNDRAGRLRLRAGIYRIAVLKPKRLRCPRAVRLFTRFLERPKGLPGDWRIRRARAAFLRGGSGVGFRVWRIRSGLSQVVLRSIIRGITRDVFIGRGIGPRQLFKVPASALTVDLPGGGSRTARSGFSNPTEDRRIGLLQVQPVGSMTKVVTATMLMQLVEDGLLAVEDTVPEIAAAHAGDGGVLRDLVDRYEDRLRDVTLRELLNHTSGLVDFLETEAFARDFAADPLGEWTLAEKAAFGLDERPLFPPGEPGRWNYSNTEYILAGMIFEAVSGDSVDDGMRRIFEQAGMSNSFYAPSAAEVRRPPLSRRMIRGHMPPTPEGTVLPPADQLLLDAFSDAPRVTPKLGPSQAAKSVSTNPNQSGPTVEVTRARGRQAARAVRKRHFHYRDVTEAYAVSVGGPAGAIVSNSQDLATFWRALFAGELVSPGTLEEMKRTVPTGENSRGVSVRWGLGFGLQRIQPGVLFEGSPQLTVWYHLGDIFGYAAAGYYVEEADLVVGNTVDIWPQPVGDLGLLRDVLRYAEFGTAG